MGFKTLKSYLAMEKDVMTETKHLESAGKTLTAETDVPIVWQERKPYGKAGMDSHSLSLLHICLTGVN